MSKDTKRPGDEDPQASTKRQVLKPLEDQIPEVTGHIDVAPIAGAQEGEAPPGERQVAPKDIRAELLRLALTSEPASLARELAAIGLPSVVRLEARRLIARLADVARVLGLTVSLETSDRRQVERGESKQDTGTDQDLELEGIGPGVPAVDLLRRSLEFARIEAWSQLLGSESPSKEDLQAWLDQVHQDVHEHGDRSGHFGSFEKNAEFARLLRLLIGPLSGLRVLDPKTGCPGMLFHRSGPRLPCGRFLIQVKRADGRHEVGYQAVKLPKLTIVEAATPSESED